MFQYGLVLKDKKFMKKVLVVAIPMMLQQLITNSVNLLDNLMVGQLGDYAISGVATSNKFFMVGVFAMMGIVTAASIFMAQYNGAKKQKELVESFRYALVGSIVVMLPFVVAALLFPTQIISFFNKDPELVAAAKLYLPLAAITFIPQALSFTIQNAMRSLGHTKYPLMASIISVISNAFFNYTFIFGHFGAPQLGITGAALGTLIARIIELTFILVVYFRSPWPFKTNIQELLSIPMEIIKKITTKSIPLLINEIGWSGGMAMLFKFYSTRGAVAIAGMTIASTTTDLFFVLFSGMAVATNVIVAHELGADNLQVAKKYGYQLLQFAVIMSLMFAIVLFSVSFLTPHLYDVSSEVKDIAGTIIRVQGFFFWIYMFNAQVFFIIRAGGDIRSTLIMDAGYMWFVNLVVVSFVAYQTNWNIYGIYIAGQATDILKMIISGTFFRKEKWVTNMTIEETII